MTWPDGRVPPTPSSCSIMVMRAVPCAVALPSAQEP